VRIVRGEGVHLYDADGLAYLDAYNHVPSVGHCHPRVVAAIARQAATLNTHTRDASELILDYAERLLGTYPDGVGHVLFPCTGSAAAARASATSCAPAPAARRWTLRCASRASTPAARASSSPPTPTTAGPRPPPR